jgi:hypothetical protein
MITRRLALSRADLASEAITRRLAFSRALRTARSLPRRRPTADMVDIDMDIGMLHDAAVRANDPRYLDPKSGNMVWTAEALRGRGRCCGCACRHCPYNHANVSMDKRASRISAPAMLHGTFADATGPVDVLFWSGGKDSFLAARALAREHRETSGSLLLLTTFDAANRQVAHQ